MNWKYFVKEILKGIQTPFFNVGSLFEEIINSVEDEKNNQWQDSVDAILKKIEQETLEKFNQMESEMQILILSQIPGCFSEKQNIKLNEIINKYLGKSVKKCSVKNVPYQTPNLLIALFSIYIKQGNT